MWPNPQETADLVTFAEEILNGNFIFCPVNRSSSCTNYLRFRSSEDFLDLSVAENAFSVGIYLFKVNDENIRTMCDICSKLTIKTPEQSQWCHSGVFVVHFEKNCYIFLVFLLMSLNKKGPAEFLMT